MPFFAEPLSVGTANDVKAAFGLLQSMAQADGTFSDLEGDCLTALVKRVSSEHTRTYTDRFPHGTI